METSTHYRIVAPGLNISTRYTWAKSTGPVVAEAPGGRIEAGLVELNQQGDAAGTYLLVFKEGVKMVYVPKPAENE